MSSQKDIRNFVDELNVFSTLTKNNQLKELLKVDIEKVENVEYHLAIVGRLKQGKSTFINQLLGCNILPVGIVPTTAIVTRVKYGDALTYNVTFSDQEVECSKEEFESYVKESENPDNIKCVEYLTITCPSSILKGGLVIVDTPGVGSVHQSNTEKAKSYIRHMDGVVFVSSVTAPLSIDEVIYAQNLIESSKCFFYVLNKIDAISDDECKELVEYHVKHLRENKIYPLKFLMVSASNNYGYVQGQYQRYENLLFIEKIIFEYLGINQGKEFSYRVRENLVHTIIEELEREKELFSQSSKAIEDLQLFIESEIDNLRRKYEEFLTIVGKRLVEYINIIQNENEKREYIAFKKIENDIQKMIHVNENNRKCMKETIKDFAEFEINQFFLKQNEINHLVIKEYHQEIMRESLEVLNKLIDEINAKECIGDKVIQLLPFKPIECDMKSTFYTKFEQGSYSLVPIKKEVLINCLPNGLFKKALMKEWSARLEDYREINSNTLLWEYRLSINEYTRFIEQEYRQQINQKERKVKDYLSTIISYKRSNRDIVKVYVDQLDKIILLGEKIISIENKFDISKI